MGLSASMWTGVSGLLSHGERMTVVGNNIANVNTIGFKGQRMDFQDFIYQDSFSAGGATQIGRGVTVGAVMGDFSQGTFEATTEVTDLAIGGRGFFKVKPQGSQSEYYTRAGNFRFQSDGTLTNPQGYVLQGWKMDNTQGPTRASGQQANAANTTQIRGSGLPTDVRLDTWSVEPLQTTKISFNVELDPKKNGDKSVYMENPFSSLLETWNGKQPPAPNTPPLSEEAYSFPVPIKVYDEAGGVHTLTMYMDKVGKDTYQGGPTGDVYEYVLTMDPSEDLRRVAIPNAGWRPGADTTLAAGAQQPASSVFGTTPAAATGWDAALKGAYTLDAKYTFNTPATAPAIHVDPSDPSKWPDDLFTTKGWQEADAAGNERNTIVDMKSTKSAGILMTGTISFDQAGNMINQTSYVLNGNKKPVKDANGAFIEGNGYTIDENGNPVPLLDPSKPADYMYPTEVSSSGYPLIVGNFTGLPGADTVGSVPDADRYLMEVDFGQRVSNYKNPWKNDAPLSSLNPKPVPNPAYDATNPAAGPEFYTATNRVANPNYSSDNTAGGPQYLYLNPNYDATKNTVSVDATTGVVTAVIGSPRYLYPENTDPAAPPATLSYVGTFTYTPPATPPELDGLVKINAATQTLTWETSKATQAILANADDLANMNDLPIARENGHGFNNKGTNFVQNVSQNGYGRGELSSWTINAEGILSGIYSNGVTLPLYQISMYDFTCKQGLRREGGNLFSETMESGQPSTGTAGSNGLGTIAAQNLEGSNVDLSREFVNMITTQRGFQSNSKIITTTDTMLETVVNMKR